MKFVKPLILLLFLFLPTWAFAAFTNGGNNLLSNEYMTSNQYLQSSDGRFRFYLQSDGNLVLRVVSNGQSLWSSATNGQGGTRLNMQSDGNLVLRNNAGNSLWSTGTQSTGANRATLQSDGNFVLYTSRNAAVWDTNTPQPPSDTTRPVIILTGSAAMSVIQGGSFSDPGATASDNVDGNITNRIIKSGAVNAAVVGSYILRYDVSDNAGNAAISVTRTVTVTAANVPPPSNGNGDNDGKANSTGQFSAPSAATYSLNNAKQRIFPRPVDTGFGGNGHAETWDGRVFVRTRTAGWFASSFRPQRITLNADGSPNFMNGAFGNNSTALELDTEAPDMQHNWIAIVPDPEFSGENPFSSTSTGVFSATGTHRTYRALVYHTSLRNNDNDQMGIRKATIIVSNAPKVGGSIKIRELRRKNKKPA